jgi:HEAT repeat protein
MVISLSMCALGRSQDKPSAVQLLEQFKSTKVFWKQFEIAKEIVALGDSSVLPELAVWLNDEDRHVRGNSAFVFASLGDNRGFDVIRAILTDRSDRPEGQGVPMAPSDGRYRVEEQIKADRYYAVHLFGDLKDTRAVPILVPLLKDEEVSYIVPWALAEIGDKRANAPLIEALGDKNPSIRVLAIYALGKLGAKEALPRLHELLGDNGRSNFDGMVSVGEAAKAAIAKLETKT